MVTSTFHGSWSLDDSSVTSAAVIAADRVPFCDVAPGLFHLCPDVQLRQPKCAADGTPSSPMRCPRKHSGVMRHVGWAGLGPGFVGDS